MPVPNGGTRVYHNGHSLSGRTIGFYPNVGAPGHHVIASSPMRSDVRGVDVTSVSTSMNTAFNLIGQFRNFFSPTVGAPFPTVDFSTPLGPAPAIIVNLMDDGVPPLLLVPLTVPTQSGFRSFEGVGVLAGIFPSPFVGLSLDILVTFSSGEVFTLPAAVTVVP